MRHARILLGVILTVIMLATPYLDGLHYTIIVERGRASPRCRPGRSTIFIRHAGPSPIPWDTA